MGHGTLIVGNSLEVYSMLVGMVELRAFMVSYVKKTDTNITVIT